MNIYSKKQRWKLVLASVAALIVFISLWYTNILVGQIAEEEKSKAKSWAQAIQRKAELVSYTQYLLRKLPSKNAIRLRFGQKLTEEFLPLPTET